MAIGARSYKPLHGTLGEGVVVIAGSFTTNGASALSASGVKGKGFTVARTDTGKFTVTLDQQYTALLSGTATAQCITASNLDRACQLGAVDVTSAKTIVIQTMAGTSPTDMDDTNKVHFVLFLSLSSLNT